jgi:hypothetical protein
MASHPNPTRKLKRCLIELQEVYEGPSGYFYMLVVPAPGWPVRVRIPERLHRELKLKLEKRR